MILKKTLNFHYLDQKCVFRSINTKDITENYLEGLRNETKYLENKPQEISRSSQSEYITNIEQSNDNCICGLFVNDTLIGTAGIQNLDSNDPISFGIFIFETSFKGLGFGKVLVWASIYISYYCTNQIAFFAGMKKENRPSLNSFISCGFKMTNETEDCYLVKLKFQNLVYPVGIKNIILFP